MIVPTDLLLTKATASAPDYEGVRVAVLGASGFIGRWVAMELCAAGASVYTAVRDTQTAEPMFAQYGIEAELVEFNAVHPHALARLLGQVQPSITFNLVGYGVDADERSEAQAGRINARFVEQLCAAVAETRDRAWLGQHLVHVGSAAEYGQSGGDVSERAHPNPDTCYGKTKLAGTTAVAASCEPLGIRGLTARLFTVYGPGEHPHRLLPSLLAAATTGQPLQLTSGEQQRDFIYVRDVATALLRLGVAPAKPGEIVNVATGQLATVRQFAETAASILGLHAGQLRFGALPVRPEEMFHRPVPLARLQQLTGWTPGRGVAHGIRDTRDFLRRSAATAVAS